MKPMDEIGIIAGGIVRGLGLWLQRGVGICVNSVSTGPSGKRSTGKRRSIS